ncbi:hypothetical protein C6Q14_01365 [Burkholderia ambifaria]|nr:hypothetical protein C6Q14_01365 [Burkholderia ambifaria]
MFTLCVPTSWKCLEYRGKTSFYQSLFFGTNSGTSYVVGFRTGHRYRRANFMSGKIDFILILEIRRINANPI